MENNSTSGAADREPDFERFLFHGAKAAAPGMDHVFVEPRALGVIDLPDGRIYACDPLVPMDTSPLAESLAPGQYEVLLFVAVGKQHGTEAEMECNAAAALVCSREAVQRWELAAREGGAPDAADYAVDSGTGSFFGSRALQLLLEGNDEPGHGIMRALAQKTGAIVDIGDGGTIAAFATGTGDGTFATWLGRDARRRPVMILTDFAVLASEEYVAAVHAQWAASEARRWWQFWK
jgi:hypothetical protein